MISRFIFHEVCLELVGHLASDVLGSELVAYWSLRPSVRDSDSMLLHWHTMWAMSSEGLLAPVPASGAATSSFLHLIFLCCMAKLLTCRFVAMPTKQQAVCPTSQPKAPTYIWTCRNIAVALNWSVRDPAGPLSGPGLWDFNTYRCVWLLRPSRRK